MSVVVGIILLISAGFFCITNHKYMCISSRFELKLDVHGFEYDHENVAFV